MRYLAALRAQVRRPSFHMTRAPGILIASLVTALLIAPAGLANPAARQEPTVAAAGSGFTGKVLRRQNAVRRSHGLGRLRVSRHLNRAARRHVRDMVRSHYFGHVSHAGRDVVDRVAATPYGRGAFSVQENLYWWSKRRSAAVVVRAWMGSAVHRANVLHRGWRQFGVAAVMRSPFGRGGITVVGVYGTHR
jgi:uncharacterized protein YkwD